MRYERRLSRAFFFSSSKQEKLGREQVHDQADDINSGGEKRPARHGRINADTSKGQRQQTAQHGGDRHRGADRRAHHQPQHRGALPDERHRS